MDDKRLKTVRYNVMIIAIKDFKDRHNILCASLPSFELVSLDNRYFAYVGVTRGPLRAPLWKPVVQVVTVCLLQHLKTLLHLSNIRTGVGLHLQLKKNFSKPII